MSIVLALLPKSAEALPGGYPNVVVLPPAVTTPAGNFAAFQIVAKEDNGRPWSGWLHWSLGAGSANAAQGDVYINNGGGRFGYTGTNVGADTVVVTQRRPIGDYLLLNGQTVHSWSPSTGGGTGVPAYVIFDDFYYDSGVPAENLHGFTVFDALGKRVNGGTYSAVIAGANGPRTLSGGISSTGYAVFQYRATTAGFDDLSVSVGGAVGNAIRSYGMTQRPTGPLTVECPPTTCPLLGDLMDHSDPRPGEDGHPDSEGPIIPPVSFEAGAAPPERPRPPATQLLAVSTNVLQAYARSSNPNYRASCTHPEAKDNCDAPLREKNFARRISALAGKTPPQFDGMRYVPDVIILQEALCDDADEIIKYLNSIQTGGQAQDYSRRCVANPVQSEDRQSIKKNDSAILFNRRTVTAVPGSRTYVTTSYSPGERPAPCRSDLPTYDPNYYIDSDQDGTNDCKVKKKEHIMMMLRKGSVTMAVASVHLVTKAHLSDEATHDTKAQEWSGKILNRLEYNYPNADMYVVGGDFNAERCAEPAPPVNTASGIDQLQPVPPLREPQVCAQRPWYDTVSGRGYTDNIYFQHGMPPDNDQSDLDRQYEDGCSSINPEGDCVTRYRPHRIDFIFSRRNQSALAPDNASHDLTCGVVHSARPSCFYITNPYRYSDHRLLWSLLPLGGN